MLRQGATRVYAVDVGYGLLDWRLRTDERVINHERTHAIHLKPEQLPEPIEFLCADLSFTSLTRVIPHVTWCLAPNARMAFLIKPQFEAEAHEVESGGIVTDPEVHERVCTYVRAFAKRVGFTDLDIIESPIKGAKGNTELKKAEL